MDIYSVLAVSNGIEFTGECVSSDSLNVGDVVDVHYHDCNGNELNKMAEVKEILAENVL